MSMRLKPVPESCVKPAKYAKKKQNKNLNHLGGNDWWIFTKDSSHKFHFPQFRLSQVGIT